MTRAGAVVDVGGTKVVSASSASPENSRRWATDVEHGADALADQISDALRFWEIRAGERAVVASAGYLDVGLGRVRRASNLPFIDYPLRDRLRELLGCRVELVGDATAATVAELTHRSRRAHENGLYVTISTGIGMGVVRERRLDWLAGNGDRELGHVRVDQAPDAEICGCGRRGCLEAYGSGSSIVRRYAELSRIDAVPLTSPDELTVSDVVRACDAGDVRARTVIGDALGYLTTAIANASRESEASVLVLGGGVMVHAGLFEPLRQRLLVETGSRISIERSLFGEHSVLHGAAAICERDSEVVRALGEDWVGDR
ncbi:ROK family protein [Microbacterium lushaniae]|uniref:ROK family protein n=1 Tax=Microbacterium lushaniae TaxID=2614639 RepID=A0A5J6L6L7_9MICO|nr:ROK family protein [Microbacterium lushaniae]QEW04319.1 ROK family protein [Microbacterium lushaniae]